MCTFEKQKFILWLSILSIGKLRVSIAYVVLLKMKKCGLLNVMTTVFVVTIKVIMSIQRIRAMKAN